MQDKELMSNLRIVADRRLLRKLSMKTGIGYSYLSKLAQGYKPLDKLSAVYRSALETGIREIAPVECTAVSERRGGATCD